MKYSHEYRAAKAVNQLADKIANITTQSWRLMEVCGGQTHSIVKYGLQQFLPSQIELIHGPGCPVCVTPITIIDTAIELALRPEIIFCSFGDMLRVPGSHKDLLTVKAEGGDVRMVYSPLDVLTIAEQNPDKEVVFFAIGFETTAPANAMLAIQARNRSISNLSLLTSLFTVPAVIDSLCASGESLVQGFLAAGHVCAIMGYQQYPAIAKKHHIPIVVTGFEPVDIMEGIFRCIRQLENGEATVENQYTRVVTSEGNPTAQQIINEVFETNRQIWRGLGVIANSGLTLNKHYKTFDALHRFNLDGHFQQYSTPTIDSAECISGEIMKGIKKPNDCIHFGKRCRPETPIGAPMVSTEGACAAYYKYNRS